MCILPMNIGWQCPGCRNYLNPDISTCPHCEKPSVTATEPTTGRCYVCGGHHPPNTACPNTCESIRKAVRNPYDALDKADQCSKCGTIYMKGQSHTCPKNRPVYTE